MFASVYCLLALAARLANSHALLVCLSGRSSALLLLDGACLASLLCITFGLISFASVYYYTACWLPFATELPVILHAIVLPCLCMFVSVYCLLALAARLANAVALPRFACLSVWP